MTANRFAGSVMLVNFALYLLGWFIPALEPATTWLMRAQIYVAMYGFFWVVIPVTAIYFLVGLCRQAR